MSSGKKRKPIRFYSFGHPEAGLSEAERVDIRSNIALGSRGRIAEIYGAIIEALNKYQALQMLSQVVAYGLTVSAGQKGITRPSPEMEGYQAVAELLQALTLTVPSEHLGSERIPPQKFNELFEQLAELSTLLQVQTFFNEDKLGDGANFYAESLQKLTRAHRGHVRNWGYFSQVIRICEELYSEFDSSVKQSRGYTVSDLISFFAELTKKNDAYLSERMRKFSSVGQQATTEGLVKTYIDQFGLDENDLEKIVKVCERKEMNHKQILLMLLSHSDGFLIGAFVHDVKTLARSLSLSADSVNAICNDFGYDLGGLGDSNMNHFLLDNPIWERPIVRLGDSFFCALPHVFFSFAMPAIEAVIDEPNRERLHDARSEYLESKIEQIVRQRFEPVGSTIHRNFSWAKGDEVYESDLVIQVDTFVVIIEAKSHKISKPALRGAPERMKRHIKEIFDKSSLQSRRLEQTLLSGIDEGQPGKSELNGLLDLGNIRHIVRVSVTLEDFGILHGCLHMVDKAGWLSDDFMPCPMMTLADLETAFDLLDSPLHILHYLKRRQDLEHGIRLVGDELDYLGLYLKTLLNIEADVNPQHDFIALQELSRDIDNFYESADHGIELEKPCPEMAACYLRIVRQVEYRQCSGWSDLGCTLLALSPEEQEDFCRMVRVFSRVVAKNWRRPRHKNILISRPNHTRNSCIAMVLYKDKNASKRDQFIESAANEGLADDEVESCVVIAKNIDDKGVPYHYIALAIQPNK